VSDTILAAVVGVIGTAGIGILGWIGLTMNHILQELAALRSTVGRIEGNYVSTTEFNKSEAEQSKLHDSFWELYNEHSRCRHCNQDDGR